MNPPGLAVHARGLVKHFGDLTAVAGLDLDIPLWVTFGVLGPNGAGKTTTMRMIACVSPPSAGILEVLGEDVTAHARSLKARIGVVPQGSTLDEDLRVRENLVVHGLYHGLGRRESGRRADDLLEFAQLTERARAEPRDLSGGMQRRLAVARALINDPELIILDEPTTGLDPQARHLVWERLRRLREQGKTMIITTHYMDEAARLCDRLVVMDRGRIIASGTPTELIAQHVPPRVVEVQASRLDPEAVTAIVSHLVDRSEVVSDRVVLYTRDSPRVVRALRDAAVEGAVIERDATLEDVFLRLTGHALVD